jgi:hypothetical protein
MEGDRHTTNRIRRQAAVPVLSPCICGVPVALSTALVIPSHEPALTQSRTLGERLPQSRRESHRQVGKPRRYAVVLHRDGNCLAGSHDDDQLLATG